MKKRKREKREGTKTEKCNQGSGKAGKIKKKKKEAIKRKSHCQMRIRTNEEILKRGRKDL